ncbi:OLC1v1033126C1 [Oldenlandia corymbosa var. corymbosa]|uniref:OLC1v1033126C1 n=1 Tax=Oldenlandia corymbosa var. corymbosa TaxID=529605 RepID=A0AAV1CQK6_OLDCO|nr:OLC1v1033126C1 [Oldenlandia corymbosa var. corymbosa]
MWPRLIASKILKKRVGSNNFVADYPSDTETWIELPSLDQNFPSFNSDSCMVLDQEETQNYKVFVGTWNVGGVEPTDDLIIDDWLETCNMSCDVYVCGFQEVVPLRAANVFGGENKKITMRWNSIIREALNKRNRSEEKCKDVKSTGDDDDELGELPKYRCIISKQMVGIMISVWIRSDLRSFIRNPSVSCVGCGLMGCLGNKGSVSVRFRLHETSFCFVCSHLASGGRGGDEKYRNSNAAEILSRTIFPKGPSLDLPRKILDHDRVVWLGDLNYRISLPEYATRVLVDKGEWTALLENDQVTFIEK